MDATLVVAPRQPNSEGEKARIKEGRAAAEVWPEKLAKARQKDVDGRRTIKHSKAKARVDGGAWVDITIAVCGYKSHVSIDRRHGIVRRQIVTDAARTTARACARG